MFYQTKPLNFVCSQDLVQKQNYIFKKLGVPMIPQGLTFSVCINNAKFKINGACIETFNLRKHVVCID